MGAYTLADGRISPDDSFLSLLSEIWTGLGHPGTWWTGAERVAMLREARAASECLLCAERKRAISPYAVGGAHAGSDDLSVETVDAVHRITTDPGRLSRRWYDELTASGVSAEQLVEMTALLAVLTIGDTLSRACGASTLSPLPPAAAGEPSRRMTEGTVVDQAWVPMVHPDNADGELAMIYGMVEQQAGFVFNVVRSLTAVPDAMRSFIGAFLPNYDTHGPCADGTLTRSQMEVLSSTTSSLNDCFY